MNTSSRLARLESRAEAVRAARRRIVAANLEAQFAGKSDAELEALAAELPPEVREMIAAMSTDELLDYVDREASGGLPTS